MRSSMGNSVSRSNRYFDFHSIVSSMDRIRSGCDLRGAGTVFYPFAFARIMFGWVQKEKIECRNIAIYSADCGLCRSLCCLGFTVCTPIKKASHSNAILFVFKIISTINKIYFFFRHIFWVCQNIYPIRNREIFLLNPFWHKCSCDGFWSVVLDIFFSEPSMKKRSPFP